MSSPPSGGGGAYPVKQKCDRQSYCPYGNKKEDSGNSKETSRNSPMDLKCSAALSRRPWYTGAPSLRSMRSSNWLNTSGVGCNNATTAHPPVVLAHARSAATMLYVTACTQKTRRQSNCLHENENKLTASSPVEISSMQSTLALVTSASDMVTRFFSPPDTPRTKSLPTMVSMHPSSASRLVTAASLSECSD